MNDPFGGGPRDMNGPFGGGPPDRNGRFGGVRNMEGGSDQATETVWQIGLLCLVFFAPNVPGSESLCNIVGAFLVIAGASLAALAVSSQQDPNEFRTDGAFQLSRNPLPGGLVMGCIGLCVLSGSTEQMVATLLLYVLFAFKARNDERLFEDDYDQEYISWAASVPRLVPDISDTQRVVETVKMALAEIVAGDHDRAAIEDGVLFQSSSDPLVIFVEERSSECKKALDLLREAEATPVVIELSGTEGNLKRAALGRVTGRYSLPSCWIGGKYVGGFDGGPSIEAPGLVRLSFQGRLMYALEAVGAILPTPGRAMLNPAMGSPPRDRNRPNGVPLPGRSDSRSPGNYGNAPGNRFGNAPGGNFGNAPGGNVGNAPGGNFGNAPGGNTPGGSFGNGRN